MCSAQDSSGKFLWWYLQSLEFHQDVAASIGNKTNIKHLNLGMNMFDKPNKEAFYLVIHFLFKKLNPSRVQEVFRHCWPVLDRKADTEFRKGAFVWLQEIANEEGNSFPKVVASHLLSPSGLRFVNLMLHLAKHVMLKTMKTFTTDHAWVPEAAAVPASSQELEMKRFLILKRQFQRVAVGQDSLIQDYQKRARRLEKSLKDHKAEDVQYDDLIKKYENHVNLEKDLLEKIQKVRSLWAEVDESLAGLAEERCVLASVIDGKVDQYVLDGKEINVKIPAVLRERMERLPLQSTAGSLYEGDQPVVLRLFELLNVALSLLSEERAKLSFPTSQLGHQFLQDQSLLMTRSKETLKNIRRKMAKEDLPQTTTSIKKLEVDWERKWAECLKQTSLITFLNEDPVLNFLSPMAPLSFEPASDANFKASIFSQYPAKLPESTHQAPDDVSSLTEEFRTEAGLSSILAEDKTEDLFSNCLASPRPASPYVAHSKSPAALSDEPLVAPTPSPFQVSKRTPFSSQVKSSALKPKAQILELEYENLASQFAEAVTMSPGDGRSSNMELEQLLNTLSDPFTTKKQIPRTPESLIMDVRTSWRKAVEEGKSDRKHGKGHEDVSVTSVAKIQECPPSPDSFSLSASVITKADPLPCSLLPSQQRNSLHSTLSWDSNHLDDLSRSSSNFIHFSIAHETFPDEENDGSMNCSGDSEELQEAEELFLPPVGSHFPETALEITHQHFNDSFTGRIQETKADHLLPALHTSSGLGSCKEKVFSLDLEQLESFTSPLRGDLTLPNLVTFSPMDEL